MTLNDPAVIAELTALHEVYEKALITNDTAVLDSMFWDSPHSLRYGVTENLYGTAEIKEFRKNRPTINLTRGIRRLEIMSFGDSAGVINLEYVRAADPDRIGRQTQFWIRFPNGWKIVSAHVSLMLGPPSYLDAVAARLQLPLSPSVKADVNTNLEHLTSTARFLMEFPLAQSAEPAPMFHPGE
jgi:hypothetical protein